MIISIPANNEAGQFLIIDSSLARDESHVGVDDPSVLAIIAGPSEEGICQLSFGCGAGDGWEDAVRRADLIAGNPQWRPVCNPAIVNPAGWIAGWEQGVAARQEEMAG